MAAAAILKNPTKPKVVFSVQIVVDTSILYCNEVLHSDKHAHHKSKMADGRHLGKIENRRISAAV